MTITPKGEEFLPGYTMEELCWVDRYESMEQLVLAFHEDLVMAPIYDYLLS